MTARARIAASILALAPACLLAACGGALTSPGSAAGTSGTVPIGGSSGGDAAGVGGADTSGVGGGQAGTAGVTGGGGAGGLPDGGTAGSLGPNCNDCTRAPIYVPEWEPVGAVMFVEPAGPGTDDLPFLEDMMAPAHVWHPEVVAFGPGVAHASPYSAEPAALLMARQLSATQSFNLSAITSPSSSIGVMLAVIPAFGAGYGSSADFAKGPILLPQWFPMRVTVAMDPPLFDPAFTVAVPGYDAFVPPILWDGPSHFLLNFRLSGGFAPLTTVNLGNFTLYVTIKDATGAGWTVGLVFTVGPDEVP